jgi:hypothetical protein
MKRLIGALSAAIVLAACGAPKGAFAPAHAADYSACRVEADRASLDTLGQRIRFIDGCMAKRGWTPTPACVETDQQGTSFCDYRR